MNVTRNVATFNLLVQVVLIVGVFASAYLGWARKFDRHCLMMRVMMGVQILLIGIIMAPQMGRFVKNWGGLSSFYAELIVHHVLGLIALALWIYVNLAMWGVVKAPRRFTWFMRSALAAWVASLALGCHLFLYLWT